MLKHLRANIRKKKKVHKKEGLPKIIALNISSIRKQIMNNICAIIIYPNIATLLGLKLFCIFYW